MIGRRAKITGASVCVFATVVLIVLLTTPVVSVDQQLRTLQRHFRRGDYPEVIVIAQQLRDIDKLTDDCAIMAGESATRDGKPDLAAEFYQLVGSQGEQYSTAQLGLAEVQRDRGEISLAEAAYNNALKILPDNTFAHSRMAFLKMVTGRSSEATPHLRKLLELKAIEWSELGYLAVPDRRVNVDGFLEKCYRQAPADPAPVIGLATRSMSRGQFEEAGKLLNAMDAENAMAEIRDILMLQCELQLSQRPALPPNTIQRFERYRRTQNQEGLFVLGAVLEENGQINDAILCFAECVNVADHLAATQHLLSLLARSQPDPELAALRRRITLMSRLESIVKALHPEIMNAEAANEISEIMTALGRHDEAVAWQAVAQRSGLSASTDSQPSADIHEIVQRCLAARPALTLDMPSRVNNALPQGPELSRSVSLIDEAFNVGLTVAYYESPDKTTDGRRMIEFTGGGVGVLDLDNDTWPDLYFTQGTDWPIRARSLKWIDAVYRNLRGERFVDVATASNLIEAGFSQGIACGDLNNDGFTDIVVANIGTNTYWLNQGDGTFEEFLPVSRSEASTPVWTTSCAVADLNGDSLPDIFEVNYVGGNHFDSLICQTVAGPRVCSPQAFKPTLDRLLLNRGDGTFEDATAAAGISVPGNGLGIIVANLDQDPELEVFVANDAMPNALWDNETGSQTSPHFLEMATVRGVAVSSEGLSQACMGIAADDFNGDGTTDLFVTNYFNEPNAVYMFDRSGFAADESLQSGIRRASMQMLGFGAQSLDANGDGTPDVFIVNGDLDDFAHEERLFRMPPQLMFNTGTREFVEETQLQANDVRNTRFRGRGVARCDWNGDGRWDLAISCLDDPVKLVTLNSESRDQLAMVTFVGTSLSRDAIGLQVTDSRGRMQALLAGSGYMASNQNALLWLQTETLTLQFGQNPETTVPLRQAELQVIVEGRSQSYAIVK